MGRSYPFSTTAASSSLNEPFRSIFLSGVTHTFGLETPYQKVSKRIQIGKDHLTFASLFPPILIEPYFASCAWSAAAEVEPSAL